MTKFSEQAIAAAIAAGIMKGGRGPRPTGANEWMTQWEVKNQITFTPATIVEKTYPEGYKASEAAKKACNVPSQRGRISVELLNACYKWDSDNNTVNNYSDTALEEVKPLYPEGYKPSKTTLQAIGKGKGRWSVEMLNKAWLWVQDNPEVDEVVENKPEKPLTDQDKPYIPVNMSLPEDIGTPLFEKWQNANTELKTLNALKTIGKVYQDTGKLPKNVTLFDLMVSDDEGYWDYSKGDGEYTRTKPFLSVR